MARLIHICPRYVPARGGVELAFQRLCEHFAASGHDVEVWTTDALTVRGLTRSGEPTASPAEERIAGVKVRRFPPRRWPGQHLLRTLAHVIPGTRRWKTATLRWSPWVPALDRACDDSTATADVVHAAGLPYSTLLLAGARLARRTRARLLMSPFTHVPAPGPAGRLMRRAYLSPLNVRLLSDADAICAQTLDERERLTAAGVPANKISVVGLGVDTARVSGGNREAQRQAWGVGPETVVIGHLANKSQDKGTIDLLQALPAVWARHPDVRVVLAGTTMASYTEHVARHPLDARVTDVGSLSEQAHRDFLAGIDIFALPSYVESFGLASLEAAAAGPAVVAYDHGGPAAIWTRDVNAALVDAGDITALGAAISDLCGDPARRARLARAGGELAAGFSWDAVFERADAAYGVDGSGAR